MRHRPKLELTWIGKENRPRLEPRILLEMPEHSYHADHKVSENDIFDNVLIHGDNLLALKALESDYAGKVKCIYIDPPYNTGSAYEHYDDGVENSIWLNLMWSRLEILKRLLMPQGVIVAQIGFDQMAYLKVIMDEIFDRSHCIGQVAVRMSHSAGMKRRAMDRRMIKNTEYLLMYYNLEAPALKPLWDEVTEYPVNYYQWIKRFPSASDPGKFGSLPKEVNRQFPDLFKRYGLKATNKALHVLYEQDDAFREFVISNKARIARKHA